MTTKKFYRICPKLANFPIPDLFKTKSWSQLLLKVFPLHSVTLRTNKLERSLKTIKLERSSLVGKERTCSIGNGNFVANYVIAEQTSLFLSLSFHEDKCSKLLPTLANDISNASKAGAYLCETPFRRSTLRPVPGFTHKHYTRLERLARYKHYS
jgi:hypothetical protein